ncbi:MAG TPA: glycosyltransferase family 39 protein [Geobacteraceae bacterium]
MNRKIDNRLPFKESASGRRYFGYAALVVVLLFVAVVRIRLLEVPFERDEGEYAYFAQLILHGVPPYLHAYSMKLPGVAAMYALFMAAFGPPVIAVHVGLLIVNALSTVMVYSLARRLFDETAAVCASAVFALLSLGDGVMGVFAHATNFVILFALAGYLLLLKALDGGKTGFFFLSGLSFGAAFLMKQHGIFFGVFALLYLVWTGKRNGDSRYRGLVPFLTGVALPFGICCLIMSACGVFDKFWFWTYRYAREYASEATLGMGAVFFAEACREVAAKTVLLWVLSGTGIIFLFVGGAAKASRQFAAGFFLFSFLAVCPGLYFRTHYFVLLLPAAALLAGLAVSSARNKLSRRMGGVASCLLPALMLAIPAGHAIYREREYFFVQNGEQVSRMLFKGNPFPESLQIAEYIKGKTSRNDRIAVLGSEPQIFVYADRISATGHIYMYGLVEKQKYASAMQQELTKEIESAEPKFIVASNVESSWLTDPDADRMIFDWAKSYIGLHYERVGVIDIFADKTMYLWDDECAGYAPRSEAYVYVYRRKGS